MGKCSMGRKPKWTEKDLKKLQKKQSKNARKHSRTRRKVATVAGETVAPNARGVYAGRRKDVQDSRTDKRHPDGLYLRSRWEANYARYLMWLGNMNRTPFGLKESREEFDLISPISKYGKPQTQSHTT